MKNLTQLTMAGKEKRVRLAFRTRWDFFPHGILFPLSGLMGFRCA
jgi:hypothetical protein